MTHPAATAGMHKLFAWNLAKTASRGAQAANQYGSSSIQGRRPSQEDRFFATDLLPGKRGCSFYAVYDGHGGDRAATYATESMHKHFVKSSGYKANDIAKALREAFHATELEFLNIAGREGLRDGTTAVCAVLQTEGTETTLTIAHVGDSRGVLCRAGFAVAVTEDHKPDHPAEKARIEALGGFVSFIGCWRAMGILAMSRAIGDLFLKPYVSAEPEIKSLALDAKEDEFLVIASDGVFDVFDNDQVVQIVRSAPSPEQGAHLLTSSAFAAGSLDNVTAVVVALRGYKAGAEPFVPSPREEVRLRLGPVGMALRGCAPEEPSWVNSLDWLHKTALCA